MLFFHRYLKDRDFEREIHKTLAEFFMGTWHNKPKPFTYSQRQVEKLKLTSPNAEADRYVVAQPIMYMYSSQDNNKKTERFNKRKISNLPYHLYKAKMIRVMLANCLLNFDWLLSKAKAFSLRDALSDYSFYESSEICQNLVYSLSLARSTLSKNPNTLGNELLARLSFSRTKNGKQEEENLLRKMLRSSIEFCSKQNQLVPKGQIFPEIDERLKYTLEYSNLPANRKIVYFSPDSYNLYAVAHPNEMIVWDLHNGEIEKQFKLWPSREPKLNVSRVSSDKNGDKKYLLLATCHQSRENPIVLVDLSQGEIIHAVKLKKHFPKLAFEENLQMEAIGSDRVLMNVVGDECDLYDLETGNSIHTYPCKAKMMSVSHDKNSAVFYLKEEPVMKVFSLVNMEEITSVSVSQEEVPFKILTTINGTIVVPKESKHVSLWDFDVKKGGTSSKLTQIELEKHLGPETIIDCGLSQDEHFLIVTFLRGALIWNIKSNKLVKTCTIPKECRPTTHKVSQYKATLTCDNLHLLAAYEDFVIMWSLKSQDVFTMNISNISSRVLEIIPSPNPEHPIAVTIIARALMFKVIDLTKFQTKTVSKWRPQLKMASGARYLDTDEDCARVVCRSSQPDDVCVIDAYKGRKIAADFQNHEVMKPHISADGNVVVLMRNAAQFAHAYLDVYHVDTAKLICSLQLDATKLRTYSFDSIGSQLVTHCEDDPSTGVEVAIWNVEDPPRKRKLLNSEVGGFSYLEYVNYDTMIAALQQYPQVKDGRDCKLRIFNAETGEQVHVTPGIINISVVSSKPFLFLVKAGDTDAENTLCEFDLDQLAIVKEHKVRPLGRLIPNASGSHGVDVAIQVFDLKAGKILHCFGDVTKPNMRQNFEAYPRLNENGRFVVWMNTHEASVNLGNVETKSVVGKVFTHTMPLSIRITCDNTVVVGTDEGYIMLYNIVTAEHNLDMVYEDTVGETNERRRNHKVRRTYERRSGFCGLL